MLDIQYLSLFLVDIVTTEVYIMYPCSVNDIQADLTIKNGSLKTTANFET